MKKKENKLVTVSLRIEEQDKQKLESICRNEGSNKSEFLRKKVLFVINNSKK